MHVHYRTKTKWAIKTLTLAHNGEAKALRTNNEEAIY